MEEPMVMGMEAIITDLSTKVGADVILGQVGALIPWLAVLIPVSLGVYFLRKMIKGASKAKVRF